MTTVYFVRHAQPVYKDPDDRGRPLTEEGLQDAAQVTEFLRNKGVTCILCSPYKRSMDTVRGLSEVLGLEIQTDEDFRERRLGADGLVGGFRTYIERAWADFTYKAEGAECLAEVQERNIRALKRVLNKHRDETVVIGTHGTALSSILHYYDVAFGSADFFRLVDWTPFIIRLDFEGETCVGKTEELFVEKEYKER